MKYDVSRDTLNIIKSFSRMCEYAMDCKYEIVSFFTNIVNTSLFQNYEKMFTIFSQSKSYILDKFIEELKSKNKSINKMSKLEEKNILYYKEASYWLGFVFMTWKIVDKLPKSYLLKYNIKDLVYGYDVLHTTSVSYSIDMIKQNYKLKN